MSGTVVIVSKEEWAGWRETVHLLNSPENAERLMASVRQAAAERERNRSRLMIRRASCRGDLLTATTAGTAP